MQRNLNYCQLLDWIWEVLQNSNAKSITRLYIAVRVVRPWLHYFPIPNSKTTLVFFSAVLIIFRRYILSALTHLHRDPQWWFKMAPWSLNLPDFPICFLSPNYKVEIWMFPRLIEFISSTLRWEDHITRELSFCQRCLPFCACWNFSVAYNECGSWKLPYIYLYYIYLYRDLFKLGLFNWVSLIYTWIFPWILRCWFTDSQKQKTI